MATEQKRAYIDYLTERLDSGESKNIVIPTAADLIIQKLSEHESIRVLDMGCFSGAMLNRIRQEVPAQIREKAEFVGADMDEEALQIGRERYNGLSLVHTNLDFQISFLGTFDIIVLANVLHEVPSVENTLGKVGDLLKEGGQLIILDGLKPDEADEKLVINFTNQESIRLFKLFAQKYKGFPVQSQDLNDGSIETRIRDLAAFLTKARYLKENYWPIESTQVYQFFTSEEFTKTLGNQGLVVDRLEPQLFTQEQLSVFIKSTQPQIDFPAKNVLIVARKK